MAKCLYLLCMQRWRCLSGREKGAGEWLDLKHNFESSDKCHVRVHVSPGKCFASVTNKLKPNTHITYVYGAFVLMKEGMRRVPIFNLPIEGSPVFIRIHKWQWFHVMDAVAVAIPHVDSTGFTILANAQIQSNVKSDEFQRKDRIHHFIVAVEDFNWKFVTPLTTPSHSRPSSPFLLYSARMEYPWLLYLKTTILHMHLFLILIFR